ncbi:MAG: MFS transporter, partial [Simkaniaceae bacterium]|nr:MFS transporter [Simkaniaceae bacterium]
MSKKILKLFQDLKNRRHAFLRRETFFSRNGIHFLNLSQLFGVINDNTFKFLSVFLLLTLKGNAQASEILFLIGTVYVLPFLLFSSSAGIFADRFSKQKMIVALKAFELFIALGGVVAFTYRSAFGSYAILFLFAFQSALFGPPKYSIIPEIVKKNDIAKANGLIVSCTYLAMIVGTFLASFIADKTNENYVISAWVCVGIAVAGLISSLFIPHTEAKGLKQKPKFFFLKEIADTLRECKPLPYIRLCIFCSAFFLFIGAFFQLNVIPYAMEALNLSKIWGGYLFQTVAIGIAA